MYLWLLHSLQYLVNALLYVAGPPKLPGVKGYTITDPKNEGRRGREGEVCWRVFCMCIGTVKSDMNIIISLVFTSELIVNCYSKNCLCASSGF